MSDEQLRLRFKELKADQQKARELKSKARFDKDADLELDANSQMDFVNGKLFELEKWFGKPILNR